MKKVVTSVTSVTFLNNITVFTIIQTEKEAKPFDLKDKAKTDSVGVSNRLNILRLWA